MKIFRRFLLIFVALIVIVIFYNQIVVIQFGTNLITYLKYSSPITKEERAYLKNGWWAGAPTRSAASAAPSPSGAQKPGAGDSSRPWAAAACSSALKA